uniref:Uncharacterized protein n=1 Tax=Helianthus annuus TaxID=4232 RepID=A0A251RLN6_HELAN
MAAMLDRLGVASCGVGGFEAEPTMRGQKWLSFPFSVARKYSTERVLGLFDLTGRKQAYRRGWLEPECEQHQQSNEMKQIGQQVDLC